ncbi:MAG: patatin-like phospholipase family protein, partial [Thiopseudomonas sp.]|nr:patatin-like phospholipase family protein [Thiopseudomonas sp.]
ITPSKVIDEIAVRHRNQLPSSLRVFLKGSGATRAAGGGVLSYLLFERDYCNELIELGYQDAMSKKTQLVSFLSLDEH